MTNEARKEYIEIISNGGTVDDLQGFIERQPELKENCIMYNGKWIPDDFFHKEDGDKIWTIDMPNECGPILFSFDKKNVFNFWTDYPDKLTPEQIEMFRIENPNLSVLRKIKKDLRV